VNSTHTAFTVYRHFLCVISAHCAAVVCYSSQNNVGRDCENYNSIRRTVAEVHLSCNSFISPRTRIGLSAICHDDPRVASAFPPRLFHLVLPCIEIIFRLGVVFFLIT